MSYEFTTMSDAEIDAFLAESRHAVMATNRVDGAPQLSPVWYLHRDGKLYVPLGVTSAKYRNLQRDPRVSVCVDGCHPDARAVTIYGTAEFMLEMSAWRKAIVLAIHKRYHENEEDAQRDVGEADDPDAALMIVTPHRVLSQDYN